MTFDSKFFLNFSLNHHANPDKNSIEWIIDLPESGEYRLDGRYALGHIVFDISIRRTTLIQFSQRLP